MNYGMMLYPKQQHPEVDVTYTVAIPADTEDITTARNDALTKLNTELLAGNGPDLLILDGIAYENYAQKGMLADLSDAVPLAELQANLTESFVEEGKAYVLPARFSVPVLIGDAGTLDGLKDLTSMQQAVLDAAPRPDFGDESPDFYEGLPEEEKFALCLTDAEDFADFLLPTSADAILQDGTLNEEALRQTSALPQQDAEAQKQAKIEAATAALEAAEETLYQAEKAAESANEAALSAAQNAEDSRNTALHALEKEEEDVAEQNELNRAAAAVSNVNAAYLQAELDQLLDLQTSGGQYLAPKAGTIVELDLVVGQPSPAVGGLLADEDADYTVEVPLTKQQAELVVVGTVLHVSQGGSGGDAAVQSLSSPDADGNVTAKATLPQGNWSASAASATATAQTARQDLVLPATAVRQDNGGNYVLAVEEQNTLLGLQNVLVSLPVTVEETGDTMVAVSGALDYQTQVVVTSNKAVQAGDTVRIKQ